MPAPRTPVAAGAASKYHREIAPISASTAEAEPPAQRVFEPESLPADLGKSAPATEPKARTLTMQIAAVYEGYQVTIAFEGTIQQLPGAIERLRALGATPNAQQAQQWSYTPDGLPICPRHGAPMKKREKQGDTWHSHVVTGPGGEDLYCRGYHGKDSPGYEC